MRLCVFLVASLTGLPSISSLSCFIKVQKTRFNVLLQNLRFQQPADLLPLRDVANEPGQPEKSQQTQQLDESEHSQRSTCNRAPTLHQHCVYITAFTIHCNEIRHTLL